jgi:transcriptional regulator
MFHEEDWAEIRKIIVQNSFATIVSCDGDVPVATHAPLRLLERESGPAILQGHIARANPHWKLLESAPRALAIFMAAHSYISPRWYDHVNVPTWNYMAVHVYGKPRLVTDADEVQALMGNLVEVYEGGNPTGKSYSIESLPADYLASQIKGIVCFEISVDDVQASFKLSQNRNDASYDSVIHELRQSNDPAARRVAEAMRSRRPVKK